MRGDDIETCEKVVVCQSNDALRGGEGLPEAGVECCGIVIACLVERDESSRRGDPSGCQGETGRGRDCEVRQGNLYMRCRVCEQGLPEQERRNRRSEFKHVPGRGKFHVCAGEREPPSGRNRCIDGSDWCDLICTLGARNDGGHGEGEAGTVARTKGTDKIFLRAFAWRKLVFRLVEFINN